MIDMTPDYHFAEPKRGNFALDFQCFRQPLIERYAETGRWGAAAEHAGLSETTVLRYRKRNMWFEVACWAARDLFLHRECGS